MPRKIHYQQTFPHGAKCPALPGPREFLHSRRLLLATRPQDVTCLICRYHLGLHKPQGRLQFPRDRKGCSTPGKGWEL